MSKKSKDTASRTPTLILSDDYKVEHQTAIVLTEDGEFIVIDETTGERIEGWATSDADERREE